MNKTVLLPQFRVRDRSHAFKIMMVNKLFLIQNNNRSLGNFEPRKRACYNLIAVLLQNKNQKPPLPTRHSTRSIYDNRKGSECKFNSL